MSEVRKVPELSLMSYINGSEEDKKKFSQEFYNGLTEYGFIVLKDHPISPALLDKAYTVVKNFFDLPVSTKEKYILKDGGGQRGYTQFGQESAKDSDVMDLKEFWHVGRDFPTDHPLNSIYPANLWPEEISEFRQTYLEMYEALEETGKIMLESLTKPLKVSKDFFREMITDGNSILRLLHYPPIPEDADPRCVRAAAHEDINLITILVSATASGLQLKDRDGKWLDVESDPNSLIVDAGDMLARITNDVIPATTHRVVNPDDGTNTSRYSMPFFIHPHKDVVLSCLDSCRGEGAKYEDISSDDFLNERLRELGLI